VKSTLKKVVFYIVNGDEEPVFKNYDETDYLKEDNMPKYTKIGYTLDGWYTDISCTIKFDTTKPVGRNLTLYAKWKPIEIKVTFDAGEGTLIGDSTKIVYYGNFSGSLPKEEKAESYFKGWQTPSGNIINSRNIVLITENTTLTAVWTDNEIYHIVTFNSNGGPEVGQQKVGNGKKVTKPDIVRRGYTFDGWYSDDEYKLQWDFEKDVVDADITLNAKWTKDIIYTITFTTGTGAFADGSKEKIVKVDKGNTVSSPETPTRAKYTFAGWSQDGNNLFSLPTTPSGDMTLYAVWERTVFAVTLDANGGAFSDGEEKHYFDVDKLDAVGSTETPTREGFTFKGWYYDGKSWNTDDAVKKDMTVFAIWKHIDDTDDDPVIDVPDDDPAEIPTGEGSKWIFKVIDGVPQVIREEP
jgi:uncharacterized repeat protein (TIGR02543 family)